MLKKPTLYTLILAMHHPVSNLQFLSDSIEKLAKGQLQAYLIEGYVIDPGESGFKPGHELETASVALMDGFLLPMDGGQTSILPLLYFSVIFSQYTLNQLSHLREVLQGNVIKRLESFLEGDTKSTDEKRHLCHWTTHLWSPAMILPPVVFSTYMQLLDETVTQHGPKCQQYVDDSNDTHLHLSFTMYNSTITTKMAQGLEKISS